MPDPLRKPIPRPPVSRNIPRKKKPGKTPVTRTEDEREVGLGGLKRRRNIDDIVDSAQSGNN